MDPHAPNHTTGADAAETPRAPIRSVGTPGGLLRRTPPSERSYVSNPVLQLRPRPLAHPVFASRPRKDPSAPDDFASKRRTHDRAFKQNASDASTPKNNTKRPKPTTSDFAKWDVGDAYELKAVLGHGSYGEVAEAVEKATGRRVAIKRINNVFDLEVDTKRILREVHILKRIKKCPHVVELLAVLPPPSTEFNELYLVFEFVETDLHKLILTPQYLTEAHVKYFLYQLLCAVNYLHSANVVHRDIKPANILLNEDCSLKARDFGLSRALDSGFDDDDVPNVTPQTGALAANASTPRSGSTDDQGGTPHAKDSTVFTTSKSRKTELGSDPVDEETASDASSVKSPRLHRQLTKHVVTRWYRPPELILLQEYTNAVDLWSCGCIFAELLSMQKESVLRFADREPLFPGRSCFPLSADNDRTYKDRLDQLNVIFDVIGTPQEADIESLGDVRHYLRGLPRKRPVDFHKRFRAASSEGVDLLLQLLQFNPAKRITVQQALNHPFLASVRRKEQEIVSETVLDMGEVNEKRVGLKTRLLKEIQDEVGSLASREKPT